MAKSKAREALEFARKIAAGAKNWIDLHNALFGIGGKLVELFPTESERVAFGKTDEHAEILKLIGQLRDDRGDPPPISERAASANGVINVRLPRSIHAALLAEAEAEDVSLNQLCVVKLCVQLQAALK